MQNYPGIDMVAELRCKVGESPLWNPQQQAWYWVDIPARHIWRLDANSGALRHWQTSEMVACIALAPDFSLIAGMESGLFRLQLGPDLPAIEHKLASPPDLKLGMRFNDGRCDRQGRFWAGTMHMDMTAAKSIGGLYRYTGDTGLSASFVDALIVQNGLAWSPDGRTMYLSDSHPTRRLIWAFDYDTDSGTPHARRIFVDMNLFPGRPDGAAIDSEGCYWTCANDAGCLLRFTPDGKLDRQIALPMAKPSMCSFGGPGLDTLLVTSISTGAADESPYAGAVLMLRPGVSGIAETLFQ